MGLLNTRWEAEYEGHRFTVARNELTKGFALECDGRIVDQKSWSMIGVGTLEGTIDHAGQPLPVQASLELSLVNPTCILRVGETSITMTQTK